MKKLLLSLFVLAVVPGVVPGSALFAQNISGNWQGSFKAGPTDVRLVIKITRADDESLKASLYNVNQAGVAINASAVSFKGSALKMTIAAISSTYEGTLSSDGNTISGTMSAGGNSMPLTLARATPETAWAIPDAPPPPTPMAADASPGFEVATIKPSNPATPGKLLTMKGRQVLTINMTVSDVMTFAYGVHARQIVGAPEWFESDKFDITGEPDAKGQPSLDQVKLMLQKLLVDRFQFKFHRDKKELSVYVLTIGKGGHKMTKSQADPNGAPRLLFTRLGTLPAGNVNMADFASTMQSVVLDKPVLDQTGLAGKWDFTLNWTPDAGQFIGLRGGAAAPIDPDGPPDLFTAIQQQLGLKLESTKAPAEVLVVDKLEKPSEN